MKHLAPLALAAASFAIPQTAQADLFMHLNFDICPGWRNPVSIIDLTGRHADGEGYGYFAEGSLNHSLSPSASGNRAYGTTSLFFDSIATEFNHSWYCSYMGRFDIYDGGGIFIGLIANPGPNQDNNLSFAVLPMGVIISYNHNQNYILQRTPALTDHFVLTQYLTESTGESELRLWIDPTDINNLGSPTLSYSFAMQQQFIGLGVTIMGANSTNNSFDELRFGTELSDVAVVPSPATLAPLLGLAMAHRRRR